MAANGWARVAKGLHLVAADGASRIAHAAVNSNVVNKHLPDLTEAIVTAGSKNAAAAAAAMESAKKSADAAKDQHVSYEVGSASAVGRRQFPSSSNEHASLALGSITKQHAVHSSPLNETEGAQIDGGKHEGQGVDTSLGKSTANKNATVIEIESTPSTRGNANESIDEMSSEYRNPAINSNTQLAESYNDDHQAQHLPEGTAVPATRLSRAFGFATLGAGLAAGTVAEFARRTFGRSNNSKDEPLILSNDANAQRLSHSLRRMRGAAMKLGQMLSIQDESIAPPALTNALAQVRKGAEAMPNHQLMQQLEDQWGGDWRDRIELEEQPFAAASIGQVHRGTLVSSPSTADFKRVAVKVQYPGVADSIESDLSNLSMLIKATGLAPPGLFLENVIRVGRDELKVECDYRREIVNQKRFQSLIASDSSLVADRFVVPSVMEELSTDRILVTELVHGGTIDKVVDLDQSERDRIGLAIMRLTMLELFVWRFMQTDPNWGNFLYDVRTRTTYLIDFGAAREYDEEFVRGYLNIVVANANRDGKNLMEESIRMGFLTGEESNVMLEAHKLSGFCLGEPFQSYEPYDFRSSRITSRISEHGSVFLKHRLTPPPEEVYTLHRKLAGAYNLCIKLGAKISCRGLLDEVIRHTDAEK